jgi:subtilisin-like proprotein convertase family protein
LTPTETWTPTETLTPTETFTPRNTPTETETPTETLTPIPTQASVTSCNSSTIAINDYDIANPYPSTINLAGLGVWTTDVNVTLVGLTHSWLSDVDMLLVGPQGQRLVIFSDVGDDDIVNGLTFTLDDSAAQNLPYTASISSGTFRPTNYNFVDDDADYFPAPAPVPSGATTLSTFNGTNPNGDWKLYIVDDVDGDYGYLNGGWCLSVKAASSAPTLTPTPTRTRTPVVGTTTFTSVAAQDGWVRESGEFSGVGGALNSTAATFLLGDDAANRQYRAILSFDTSSLPDNATVQSAQLKILQNGASVGKNPFTTLGTLWVDIIRGSFAGNPALQLSDFSAASSALKVGAFGVTPVGGWYSSPLNVTGRGLVNKVGLTQFRLRFNADDNNNFSANYMRFISGDYTSGKPVLVITYSAP